MSGHCEKHDRSYQAQQCPVCYSIEKIIAHADTLQGDLDGLAEKRLVREIRLRGEHLRKT